ncbi:MAG: hypothetical protein ACFFC1_19175 [Promethearchaeota archaeon]
MSFKVCNKCLKRISKKSNYFEVKTYMRGELNKTEYMHIECHNEIEEMKINQINQLGNMISGMMDFLSESMGINPVKKVILK